ncbi:MAG: extracellular solute-binding protein [Lachnospiraceae bacterium]|nr:extracellular solute-binding protein [Lachnospiraceae bacterium]
MMTRRDFLKAMGVGGTGLASVIFAGCGSSDSASGSGNTGSSESTAISDSAGSDSSSVNSTDTFSYPMEAVTLTINASVDGTADYYDLSEVPEWAHPYYYHVVMRDKTGVTAEDVGGAANATTLSDSFNLMLVSGELPDVIIAPWQAYTGGAGRAIDEGYIVDLMDYSEYIPNLLNYLDENPAIAAQVLTPDGRLGFAPFIGENPYCSAGLVIRKDWLDELGLDQPTTIDEMYNVLKAFKENYEECRAPMTFEARWLFQQGYANTISSAWMEAYKDYVVDGEVRFGPLTEGYREFIETLAQWYSEGLLDSDFAAIDKSTVQTKFSTGLSGVSIQQINNIKNCISANEGTDYAVIALESLVMNKGEEPKLSMQSVQHFEGNYCYSVSTSCSDIEAACRWLDWRFSEEGIMTMNYGIEGVTYEVIDGEVQLTELITDNEETPDDYTARGYVAWFTNRAGITRDFVLGYTEEVITWIDTWTAHMDEYVLPTINYTEEQNEVINAKWTDVDDYCQEYILKFVLGTEDMSNWDSFVQTIKSMGAEEVLAAKQEAYDSYQEMIASLSA